MNHDKSRNKLFTAVLCLTLCSIAFAQAPAKPDVATGIGPAAQGTYQTGFDPKELASASPFGELAGVLQGFEAYAITGVSL